MPYDNASMRRLPHQRAAAAPRSALEKRIGAHATRDMGAGGAGVSLHQRAEQPVQELDPQIHASRIRHEINGI